MPLLKHRIWHGARRLRSPPETSWRPLLDWPNRYLQRFVAAHGDQATRSNFAKGWLVVTDYSGCGSPEFALRCIEDWWGLNG